ncbi:MAG: PAN domain-containing protein [Aestuariivirga sp.]
MIRAMVFFLLLAFPVGATAAEIRLVPGAAHGVNYITVIGTFELGDDQKFIQIALPLETAIVAFNSEGGNLSAGLGMGRAIRLKEFSTLVPKNSLCASACGLAWLGGFERLVEEGAQVGFHAAYITNNGQSQETGMGNALSGAYLNQLGLTQSAIAYVTEAAPQNMKWLTAEDAKRVGIAMTIVSSNASDAPLHDSASLTPPQEVVPQTAALKRLASADIFGFDLPSMPIRGATLESCEAGCTADPHCKAYTFKRAGSFCYLKSDGSQVLGNPLAETGYKLELEQKLHTSPITILERTDLPGSDYEDFKKMTLEQCTRTCEYDKKCSSFTFVQRGGACWLKSGIPNRIPSKIAISGLKN